MQIRTPVNRGVGIEGIMEQLRVSLRSVVEKWLGAAAHESARVFRLSDAHSRRYVRVVLSNSMNEQGMFFFRHHDGSWRVFPPERKHLQMSFPR
jgi:pyridoxine/pyridoxamine 5'-phosphate oxidase